MANSSGRPVLYNGRATVPVLWDKDSHTIVNNESACHQLFESLDWLEDRLQQHRYLLGDLLTEADWRLFPTLVRFDAVYYGHFKCNLRHVYEYPGLWGYTRELYQMPGNAATVSIEEYKMHYYGSHGNLNPAGIIPMGPELDLRAPHGR